MDADAAMDASSLCSIYQPLDVLRLELQNEPAYSESSMPKDDHTLTYVSSFPPFPLLIISLCDYHLFTQPPTSDPFSRLPRFSRARNGYTRTRTRTHRTTPHRTHRHSLGISRRFLKARGYNASQAKQMVLDCIQWRRTVEDVGIEELYRRIDPFDVRSALPYPLTPALPPPAHFPRDFL
jgi:hypothetical protein